MFNRNITAQSLNSKSAFTLIELLVVIVIIGILATLATIALTSSRVSARDAKRISDLKQISTALELYQADYNTYPSAITGGNAMTSPDGSKTYMAKVPSDTSANTKYGYFPIRNNDFQLAANLEKGTGNLSSGPVIMSAMGSANATGLVGWWPLNGGSLANDISGGGNHGVMVGSVPLATGRYDESEGAYSFSNNVSNWINLGTPNIFALSEGTVSVWFVVTAVPASFAGVFWKGSNNNWSGNHFSVGLQPGNNVGMTVGDGAVSGTYHNSVVGTYATDGTWHNAIMSWNGTVFRTAYDCVMKALITQTVVVPNSVPQAARIGSSLNLYPFSGRVADLRVYNRALSDVEMVELCNATKP